MRPAAWLDCTEPVSTGRNGRIRREPFWGPKGNLIFSQGSGGSYWWLTVAGKGDCQLRFGEFRVDTAERLLARGDERIALPPKAFDLLALLAGNAGRLLTKKRIMDELWPATFVEEANLANLIGLLRKALADTRKTPAYIETVPKGGYRFVAPVGPGEPAARKSPVNWERRAAGGIRFIAFPFRSDAPEGAEFLAHSLPEAIAATLAELNAFTVRSTRLAARFDRDRWDPCTVAAEADVDVILSGTVVRADGQIHATTELMDARSATVLWSKVWHVPAGELHLLHRGIVQLIIRSLIRRTREEGGTARAIDTPGAGDAYELYLRANELSLKRSLENIALARDLYLECTEVDPEYAPAWARLARCYRWLEKFAGTSAAPAGSTEAAFARAFQLNPHLAIAHSTYTPIQCDAGHAIDATVRLIGVLERNGSNPELFAALVHSCRYCGLLDASVAAHERAFQLDRNLPTSAAHTFFALGDYEKALHWYDTRTGMYLDVLALTMMGRLEDASALMWTRRDRLSMQPALMNSLWAYLIGDAASGMNALREAESRGMDDPEVLFYLARQAARFGDSFLALRLLTASVTRGYGSSRGLLDDPWLRVLHRSSEFEQILLTVRARERETHEAFLKAGGQRVLAVQSGSPAIS
ncbi:MAG TPA: winged helix-turn-helix domain-containing protein [Bryobacteraceae bacterium]|nr:winged helix-turn-helix domain-containing protein [Bryobacteraceae bacterium]